MAKLSIKMKLELDSVLIEFLDEFGELVQYIPEHNKLEAQEHVDKIIKLILKTD